MEDQVWLDKAAEAREGVFVEDEQVEELLSKINEDVPPTVEQPAKDVDSTTRIKVTFVMDVPKKFLKQYGANVSLIQSQIDAIAWDVDGVVRSINIE